MTEPDLIHDSKFIVMKYIDVDIEMIPIINWLNSHHYIFTQFCCEGREEGNKGWDHSNKGNINSCYKPYVSFITNSFAHNGGGNPKWEHEFSKVLKTLNKYGEFDDKKYDKTPPNYPIASFCFRFTDKNKMREFIKKEL